MERDLELTSERFPCSLSEVIRTLDRGLWRFNFPFLGDVVEVLLIGDDTGPDAVQLDLARRVVMMLGAFSARSNDYLRHFIDDRMLLEASDRPLTEPAEWEPTWLEFGTSRSQLPEAFEIVFAHAFDGYGVWGVTYFHGWRGFRPCEFRRVQR